MGTGVCHCLAVLTSQSKIPHTGCNNVASTNTHRLNKTVLTSSLLLEHVLFKWAIAYLGQKQNKTVTTTNDNNHKTFRRDATERPTLPLSAELRALVAETQQGDCFGFVCI